MQIPILEQEESNEAVGMSYRAGTKRVSHNFTRYLLSAAGLPKRFTDKVLVDSSTGCWNWTGATNSHPKFPEFKYGRYAVDGKSASSCTYAHRFIYEFVNGPVLDGLRLDIDHICRNTICVNPAHLRALTHRDNLIIGKRRTRVPGSIRWLREQKVGL